MSDKTISILATIFITLIFILCLILIIVTTICAWIKYYNTPVNEISSCALKFMFERGDRI